MPVTALASLRCHRLGAAALGAGLALATQLASATTPPAAEPVTVASCIAQPLPSGYEQIQAVYLAFYQRPGDPAGLRYWAGQAGGDMAAILPSFGHSAEARRLYGEITPETVGEAIDKIYQGLFDKAPDAKGKQFYIDGFKDGRFSAADLAYRILQGAQNEDKRAIDNKLAAANFFTRTVDADLDGRDQQATYDAPDEVAVRQWLGGITAARVPTPEQARQFVRERVAAASDPLRSQGQPKPQWLALTPGKAQIGQESTFTITGQHLPSSARLSMGDVVCQEPAQVQCDGSGFTQSCTLGGQAGARKVALQTAQGGQSMGRKTIAVEAAPAPQPQPQPPKPSPKLDGIMPWRVALGHATVFTVKGQNLPATAILQIPDAQCSAPTDVQADGSGFKQRCTLQGQAGERAARVRTDVEGNGGMLIDGVYGVMAESLAPTPTPAPTPPQKPYVTGFGPVEVVLNRATDPHSFEVQGEGLPTEATLSIQWAQCDSPHEVRADGSGFKQICRVNPGVGWSGGPLPVQVLTGPGGQAIATYPQREIQVQVLCPPPFRLTPDGICL